MFDRPQIISPENHPQDCVVFVERAKTVSAFLRAADALVLNGEHRIICWRPPHGESIADKLKTESRSKEFNLRSLRIENARFYRETNMHFDNSDTKVSDNLVLNGQACNLTQTLNNQNSQEKIGTNLFFLPLNHPGREHFYKFVSRAYSVEGKASLETFGVKDGLRGPFSLAVGNAALLLPAQFSSQATLHGLPVYRSREKSDTRSTLIATVEPKWPR